MDLLCLDLGMKLVVVLQRPFSFPRARVDSSHHVAQDVPRSKHVARSRVRGSRDQISLLQRIVDLPLWYLVVDMLIRAEVLEKLHGKETKRRRVVYLRRRNKTNSLRTRQLVSCVIRLKIGHCRRSLADGQESEFQ